jgi:hypothetical protein
VADWGKALAINDGTLGERRTFAFIVSTGHIPRNKRSEVSTYSITLSPLIIQESPSLTLGRVSRLVPQSEHEIVHNPRSVVDVEVRIEGRWRGVKVPRQTATSQRDSNTWIGHPRAHLGIMISNGCLDSFLR